MQNYKLIITNKIPPKTIRVKRDQTLGYVLFLDKGWHEKQRLTFEFKEENATLHFLAIMIGKNKEKFPLETVSVHKNRNTRAYYTLKSALFDESEVDYTGNLKIEKNSHSTDCYLAHHTLMLSKNAKTNSVPCLEIETDDVKAGHAATIGNIDEELTFYLESRGLDKKSAKILLIKNFLESELKHIPDEKSQKSLIEKIEKSLKGVKIN
ncbi:SufD family Fe-S cluster assembly protein [Candidatus Peregrinibacteria bacterium]|nr:SufD family Fe-S cluster assembly protein [Candidatus Peregrinibacteria bacterium]